MKATRKMNPEKMGTFVPEGRLMTVRETSAMLDLHESTLSHWRKRGVGLRYTKLGSQYFYDPRDVVLFAQTFVKDMAMQPIKWEETA